MTRRGRVVVLAAACLVSATLALVQRQPSSRQDNPTADARPQLAAAEQPAPKAPAPRRAVRKAAVNKRPAASATTLPVPVKSDVTMVVTAPAPRGDQAAPVQVVTLSGCLERDDQRFRLSDTTGDDAPKSRSWRSGFLRKNTSTIDVVDQADRLHLPTYVGQRVSVTGTLVDREIQVRSVSIVAESCREKSA